MPPSSLASDRPQNAVTLCSGRGSIAFLSLIHTTTEEDEISLSLSTPLLRGVRQPCPVHRRFVADPESKAR